MTDGDRRVEIRLFQTAAVFYFLLALGGVVWIGLERGSLSLELFFEPRQLAGDLALGVASALFLLALWHGARQVFGSVGDLERKIRSLLLGVTPAEALALALISGFTEEFFFRGAVQSSFGWLWATLIFAAMHTGRERGFGLWTGFALIAGGIFAGLTVWRGTLLPAIVGHTVVNGVQLLRLAREAAAEVPEPVSPSPD